MIIAVGGPRPLRIPFNGKMVLGSYESRVSMSLSKEQAASFYGFCFKSLP